MQILGWIPSKVIQGDIQIFSNPPSTFFKFIVVMFDDIPPKLGLVGFRCTVMNGTPREIFGFECFSN